MPVLIAKRETISKGHEMTHTGIKAKTRVQARGKSITAHMTDDQYERATKAADICCMTDSRFSAVAISVVSKLVLMRVEHGWRRVLQKNWWILLKGIL